MRKTIDFLLNDWLDVAALAARERYSEHSRETFASVLDACQRIAEEKFAPFNRLVDGELQCGLLDWGCVGRMSVAMPIWGALSAAETSLWDQHFDDLLTVFTDEVRRRGGAVLDPDELGRQVLAYAAVMGATWLLDVPGRLRATLGDATTHLTRFDPEISGDENLRAPLQMLTNLLNLWSTRDVLAAS